MQELKLGGLSPGRVWHYATRSTKIARWFDKKNVQLKNATKQNCKECFQHILDPNHKGPTKAAYARTLKRLIHFAKTGEIGERTFDSDYVDEVRWIRPSKYDSEYRPYVKAEDLLTPDELVSIFKAVPSVSRFAVRDKPMVMCMFEGAFRPGEILQMRIEGIRFENRIAWVRSTGKTGVTDAKPLVISCEPLLQWLKNHPHGSDADAPVWWSFRTKSVVSLAYLERLVKNIKSYKTSERRKVLALLQTGAELSQKGNYTGAIICYDKALAIVPDDSNVLVNKGDALTNLGRYEEARKCYDKVLAKNPNSSRPFTIRHV